MNSGDRPAADLPLYLKTAMREAGYRTQTALAQATDLDVSYLGKIMRGVVNPTVPTLEKLAKALRRPINEVARAAGYPVLSDAPPAEIEDQTLRDLMVLLEDDPAFMQQLDAAKPLDARALRDIAELLKPYLGAIRRARESR